MVSSYFQVGRMKIMQSYVKFSAEHEYLCRKSQKVVQIVVNNDFKNNYKNFNFLFPKVFLLVNWTILNKKFILSFFSKINSF